MVDVQYAQFKENIIKEIRKDEEQYTKLQDEIKALEAEIEAEARSQTNTGPTATNLQAALESVSDGNGVAPFSSQPPEPPSAFMSETKRPDTHTPNPQPQPVHVPFDRNLPPRSPQRNDYGPLQEQHGFTTGPPQHNTRTLPHLPGLSPMHPPLDVHAPHRRTPSGSAPGRGSPRPYPPQPQYQPYPPYNPPQQPWPPAQPYPQNGSPHASPQFYQHPPPNQAMPSAGTPMAPHYQYYPQSAPIHHFNRSQPVWQAPVPYPPYVQPASAGTTPLRRRDDTPSRMPASGSSTPWKRKHSNLAGLRAPSPVAPREVSPLSDVGSHEPDTKPKMGSTKGKQSRRRRKFQPQHTKDSRTTRRTRAGSTASSALGRSSRSQSLASFASDTRPEADSKGRSSKKIKPEPPSTPAPFPSDSENQRSSGRRRTRGDTLTSLDASSRPNLKRKRDSIQPSSPPTQRSSPEHPRVRRQLSNIDPNLVSVSKTFNRVASQLLNRVTEHKYASIFAKPLSEREAPGYKDLIYRPQDLKSIKAAIVKGSKAAIAAVEEIERERGETPAFVEKTEDLVPPKGVVNTDQLEMELMRMFANAVMFNPLPDSERGLPAARHLRSSVTPSQAGELGYAGSEEGGIIQDAREMFDDVVGLIETFRAAEQDRIAEEVA